jgi:glutathione S-transferase
VLTLYDADRCPFCARARIALAEKGIEYETVQVDLGNRPAWLYEKNPLGKVPVLEEGAFVLPESPVIMEYLEERYPDPPLLPLDPAERGLVRLWIEQFDTRLGSAHYAVMRGEAEDARARLDACLQRLDSALEAYPFLGGTEYGLADIAYIPWILRDQVLYAVELAGFPALEDWVERLSERAAIAAELSIVGALAAR